MGRIKSRLMNEEVRAWEEYALRLEQKIHADFTGLYNGAWRATILIGILFLFACSPQKQLERLIKKHPELVKSDTIKVRDTIRLKSDKADTVFKFSHRSDTVILDKGRLQVKYYYSHDSVFLSGKCRDSVIIREHAVQVNTVQPIIHQGINTWWRIAAIAEFLIAGLFVLLFKR